MPLYSYKCSVCGDRFDRFLRLADWNAPQQCGCGGAAEKQLTAARVIGDYSGYACPVTGKWVEGKRAHRENLARHNCRILEPGEKEQNSRRQAEEERKLDLAVGNTVEQLIHEMPSRKRELLEAELSSGVDVSVVRS